VSAQSFNRAALLAIVCGSFIVLLSFGIRSGFGLFLQPMSQDLGWGREVFAFALALQNLIWGASQPFVGMLADKWGSGRTLAGGGLLYAFGVWLMAQTASPLELYLSAGVLVGLALSGTGFAVVLAAVGRNVAPERRSAALGITTALGSFGQFLMPPLSQTFLAAYGWQAALVLLAFGSLLMVAAALGMQGRPQSAADDSQTLGQAIAEARRHPGFLLLTAGFFVCGWHVAFIAVHLPAYLADGGLPSEIAAWCLALVGLFNVIGSYTAGVLGGRLSKKYCLSVLYLARAILIFGFIMLPLTAATALVFSAVMGLLWLSTVPLTSGRSRRSSGRATWQPCSGLCSSATRSAASSGSGSAAGCTIPTAATT
jgi:MFS family permease